MSQPATLIRGGTVYLERGPDVCDLLFQGARITAIGKALTAPTSDTEVVDATGLRVLPGLIDLHVHVDDEIGGIPLADTFASASAAALPTGVTTLAAFATLPKDGGCRIDEQAALILDRGRGNCHCDFTVHLSPTRWEEETWAALANCRAHGLSTVKLYTTYRETGLMLDYEQIEAIARRAAALDLQLLVHCEDQIVLDVAASEPGSFSDAAHHGVLRPEAAELEAIRQIIAIAERTDCRMHVVHISTAQGASLIAASRCSGRLSAETCPHYLVHSSESLRAPDGYRLLCSPPLRSPATRDTLRGLVIAGQLDVLATDHCAFTAEAKDAHRDDLRAVAMGIAGLGALAPVTYEELVVKGFLPLTAWCRMLTATPARVLGYYPQKGVLRVGSDADLVLFDPVRPARTVRSSLVDVHETYPGYKSTWCPRRVYLRGQLVAADGVLLLPAQPRGVCPWND